MFYILNSEVAKPGATHSEGRFRNLAKRWFSEMQIVRASPHVIQTWQQLASQPQITVPEAGQTEINHSFYGRFRKIINPQGVSKLLIGGKDKGKREYDIQMTPLTNTF